jgi:hypothetical protein
MILTRDEILDAIDRTQSRKSLTIADAFSTARDTSIWDYMGALGLFSKGGGFSRDDWGEGREQRLLFLAFLLTWHDEIMEGKG